MNRYAFFSKAILCAALSVGAGSSVYAASFDCEKASNKVEQLICNNDRLNQQDESLAFAYRNYLKIMPKSQHETIRKEQIAWLKARNACLNDSSDSSAVSCIDEQMSARTDELVALWENARIAFDADVVALIPTQPQEAAEILRSYSSALASIWLVYLHEFMPESGVSKEEAKAHYQQAKNGIDDPFGKSIFESIEENNNYHLSVFTLLRLLLEQNEGNDGETAKHCFIFANNDQNVYQAFGPLYGSSRDNFSPLSLCSPSKDNLFTLPEWKVLNDLFEPVINDVDSISGTIRASYFLGWRRDALKANIQPKLYLLNEREVNLHPNYNYPHVWQAKQLEEALNQAETATKQWLQEKQGIEAAEADVIAKRIVYTWLNNRLGFIDDFVGLDELERLYQEGKTVEEGYNY